MVLTTVLTIFGTFAVVRDWYLCTTPMPDEHAVTLGAFCAGYAHTWIPIIVLLSLLTLLMRFALYSSPDRQETGRQAVPGTRKEEECNRDNGGNASLEGW
jgi:ABC-type Mn2+/Zn2+ transport system permease subunit